MAEQLPHRIEVCTRIQQMGCIGVAQGMGRQRPPGRFAEIMGDATLNPTRTQRTPRARQKQVSLIGRLFRNQLFPSHQIRHQRDPSRFPERNQSLFVALAHNPHQFIGQIHSLNFETRKLTQSDPRAVKQLHNRPIAQSQHRIGRRQGHRTGNLVNIQMNRQYLILLGRTHVECWILRQLAHTAQITQKCSHRRQLSGNRPPTKSPIVQEAQKIPHRIPINLFNTIYLTPMQKSGELIQIRFIRRTRMIGQSPLPRQVVEKLGNGCFHGSTLQVLM